MNTLFALVVAVAVQDPSGGSHWEILVADHHVSEQDCNERPVPAGSRAFCVEQRLWDRNGTDEISDLLGGYKPGNIRW